MLARAEIFPGVIELNFQARKRLGCCVYLVFDGPDWMLIDIGYDDTVDEIINLMNHLNYKNNEYPVTKKSG